MEGKHVSTVRGVDAWDDGVSVTGTLDYYKWIKLLDGNMQDKEFVQMSYKLLYNYVINNLYT